MDNTTFNVNPLPSAPEPDPQNPPPTTPSVPPKEPASSPLPPPEPKAGGFFTGKVLIALIAVVLIGGGVALGYFVFPETFYNTVGKYLGLPAPAENNETETETSDAGGARAEDFESLLAALPGANANFVMRLRNTSALAETLGLAQQAREANGGTPLPVPDEDMEALASIADVVTVGNVDYKAIQAKQSEITKTPPATLVLLRVAPEKEAFFLQKLEEGAKQEDATEEKYSYESKGNGIILVQTKTVAEAFTGKLSDNPLFINTTADENLFISLDLKEIWEQALKENPPSTPKQMEEAEFVMKISGVAITGTVKREGGVSSLEAKIRLTTESAETVEKLLEITEEYTTKAKLLIPPQYQSLITFDVTPHENVYDGVLVLKDLESLAKNMFGFMQGSQAKAQEAFLKMQQQRAEVEASVREMEAEGNLSPVPEETPAPPSTTGKVPRKKTP